MALPNQKTILSFVLWRSITYEFRSLLTTTIKGIRNWLTPLYLKSESEVRKCQLLISILMAIFVTNVIAMLLTFLDRNNPWYMIVICYGFTLTMLSVFAWLLKRGKINSAVWSLAIFLWIELAGIMVLFGGLHSQVPAIFIVVIMFVGATEGGKWAIRVSFITITFFALIALLQWKNFLPAPLTNMTSPINSWVCLSVGFPLMAVLLNNLLTTLQVSDERYQLAIQGSSTCIWDWDIASEKMYFSHSLQTLLGYTPPAHPQCLNSFTRLIHTDDRSWFFETIDNHFADTNKLDVEFRMLHANGSYQWIHCKGAVTFNYKKEAQRMVACLMDITERKLTAEKIAAQNVELVKTNAELDQFVYRASHDLRSPISSVLGLINLIRIEQNREAVLNICALQEKSLVKMDRFIADITNYSHNTRKSIHAQPINFTTMFNEVFDQLEFLLSNSAIQITMEIEENLLFHSDPSRVEIILRNIISNCIRYADKNKSLSYIKTSVTSASQGVIIKIDDNGEGIANEHLDHVCDMFYRASDKSTGSGIGLYIVKEMIEKLKGHLIITSTRFYGTEMTIYLPDLRQLTENTATTQAKREDVSEQLIRKMN